MYRLTAQYCTGSIYVGRQVRLPFVIVPESANTAIGPNSIGRSKKRVCFSNLIGIKTALNGIVHRVTIFRIDALHGKQKNLLLQILKHRY